MKKYTRERHSRRDATAGPAPRGFAACSRVITRLATLAQIGLGKLARRLARLMPCSSYLYGKAGWPACQDPGCSGRDLGKRASQLTRILTKIPEDP